MSGIAKALSRGWAKASISADDWPGVVATGPNWRVALNRTARRYIVQGRVRGGLKPWGPLLVPWHRPEEMAALAPAFPGLPEALAAMPGDPIDLAARLAAERGIPVPIRRRKYWLADDYAGVLAVDANVRIVVDAPGAVYAIQWRPIRASHGRNRGAWITQAQSPSLAKVTERVARGLYEPGADPEAGRGSSLSRLAALTEGLPENAAEGPWAKPGGASAARGERDGEAGAIPSIVATDHGNVTGC